MHHHLEFGVVKCHRRKGGTLIQAIVKRGKYSPVIFREMKYVWLPDLPKNQLRAKSQGGGGH